MMMEIETIKDNGIDIVYPIDRLDTTNFKEFETFLQGLVQDNAKIIISFAKLNYISSAGLRILLVTAKSLKAKNGSLVLCDMKKKILEVFQISGFDKILKVVGDIGEGKCCM